jgi:hypothetical protein
MRITCLEVPSARGHLARTPLLDSSSRDCVQLIVHFQNHRTTVSGLEKLFVAIVKFELTICLTSPALETWGGMVGVQEVAFRSRTFEDIISMPATSMVR